MREMNSGIGIEAFLFPYCKMQIIFFPQLYGYCPLYGCQIMLILLFVSTEAAAAQIRSFPRLLIFQTNNLTISFCGEWPKYVEGLANIFASAAFDPKLLRETGGRAVGHTFSLHIIGTGAGTKEEGGESLTSKKWIKRGRWCRSPPVPSPTLLPPAGGGGGKPDTGPSQRPRGRRKTTGGRSTW